LDQAQLEGVSLNGAELRGVSIVGANLYRTTRDSAVVDVSFEYNSTTPTYEPGRALPIDDKVVDLWISTATAHVRDKQHKSLIVSRLEQLRPKAISATKDQPILTYWASVKSLSADAYQKVLGDILIGLACKADAAPFVAKGLLKGAFLETSARVAAAGPHLHNFARMLQAERTDPDACLGGKGFVELDWELLGRLVDAAPMPTIKMILEGVCSPKFGSYIARAYMKDGLADFEPEQLAIIANKLRAARYDHGQCPGVSRLTDADWKLLASVSPEASAPVPSSR
jgi:hypothetical protein